jgi:hypothetical protein
MVSSDTRVFATFTGTVRPCPACGGRQITSPFVQEFDPACIVCGGLGTVDLSKVCDCGRPIVFKIQGKEVCTALPCQVEAVAKAKKVTVVNPAAKFPHEMDKEEYERYMGKFSY